MTQLMSFSSLNSLGELVMAVLSIILLDLLLSGDNAAVIGMAICRLPGHMQKKAALCGAAGAIILRIIFTVFASLLLTVPYFKAAGGIILLIITWKLLKGDSEEGKKVNAAGNFWSAVGIILLADLSMAFDNVIAVAGAAHGEPVLVIFGLIISIPILVFCSTLLSKIMNKYPLILWLGGSVLVHTALKMIFSDTALNLSALLGPFSHLISMLIPLIVFILGLLLTRESRY